MTVLEGKLIDVMQSDARTNKTTGEMKQPELILSVMSKFRNFGNVVPKIVEVKTSDLSRLKEFQDKIGKDIKIPFYMELPKFPIMIN